MEIVKVEDWEADFRDRVRWKRGCYENVIIPTNEKNVQLCVIQDSDGSYFDPDRTFYVAIESTIIKDYQGENEIIGCVELLERDYKNVGKVFEPHSFLDKEFRGKGYVEGVYRWILDNDFRLVSGERQTVCSDGLWKKLSKDYEFNYYDIWNDEFYSESEMSESTLEASWVRKTLKKRCFPATQD
jgi:hypothetical protein